MSITAVVVLAVVATLVAKLLLRNAEPPDVSDADKVLREVEVYITYKRREKAFALLKVALERHPNDDRIKAKFDELTNSES